MSANVVAGGAFCDFQRVTLLDKPENLKRVTPTFCRAESSAAEYLNPFKYRSYTFNLRLRLLSTLSSSMSPTGLLLVRSLTRSCPMSEKAPPRKDSRVVARREGSEVLCAVVPSDAFGWRRRTESVPSDMPTAMWVSSGYVTDSWLRVSSLRLSDMTHR